MRAETQSAIDSIKSSLSLLHTRIRRDSADERLAKLDAKLEVPGLWNDPKQAQDLMRNRQALADAIESYDRMENRATEYAELIELGEAENDEEIVLEAEEALANLQREAAKKELETLLSGEVDGNDAFLEINAGAGGTESCDWASMLARMYERWAARQGYSVAIISQNREGEAGVKSITFRITGTNAYGWLKTESGVHRLVRNSPFDSAARRHTSFSSVWVYPVVDEDIEIEVNQSDLRIDTFRASGAGGQHVNKTDSAVRITHEPSGIVVTSSEKSQHQNRAICMQALKSRLYELELRKRHEEQQEQHMNKGDAAWGNQIRSYVLQPYQLVKDLRTDVQTSNTQAVLDGDLDEFMAAALAKEVTGKSRAAALAGRS